MVMEKLYKMSDSVKKFYETLGYHTNHTHETGEPKRDKIVEDVIERFRQRSAVGIQKYGTTLYDSPDGFYEFLNHTQMELMDAILYIEKLKQQK